MPEWSTYSLEDFLMFSPATYWRMVDQYHRDVWPAQLAGLAIGIASVWLTAWQRSDAARIRAVLLAAVWLWVGWAFYLQKYATIHWAAGYFAAGFALQGALFLMLAFATARAADAPSEPRRAAGWTITAVGLVLLPLASVWLGRPWSNVEIFGVSPHATALTSLGLLLASREIRAPARWMLSIVPVLSLAEGALTLTSLARMQGA